MDEDPHTNRHLEVSWSRGPGTNSANSHIWHKWDILTRILYEQRLLSCSVNLREVKSLSATISALLNWQWSIYLCDSR